MAAPFCFTHKSTSLFSKGPNRVQSRLVCYCQ